MGQRSSQKLGKLLANHSCSALRGCGLRPNWWCINTASRSCPLGLSRRDSPEGSSGIYNMNQGGKSRFFLNRVNLYGPHSFSCTVLNKFRIN
uniref:Uncharacterized protein n=1 Tax=Rhizoctonia solani TaxID=456999 RepID=N0A6S8_9AGAM|nr:hypothetical protein RSOL_m00050 [Rhizoctonia solani]AGK45348.1 hypothetical protein RSOL_m00050 [Rhizoctonia solani]